MPFRVTSFYTGSTGEIRRTEGVPPVFVVTPMASGWAVTESVTVEERVYIAFATNGELGVETPLGPLHYLRGGTDAAEDTGGMPPLAGVAFNFRVGTCSSTGGFSGAFLLNVFVAEGNIALAEADWNIGTELYVALEVASNTTYNLVVTDETLLTALAGYERMSLIFHSATDVAGAETITIPISTATLRADLTLAGQRALTLGV